eukprot:COSAG02_NODE_341_length_24173_cov_28.504777_23_plen_79_part_00
MQRSAEQPSQAGEQPHQLSVAASSQHSTAQHTLPERSPDQPSCLEKGLSISCGRSCRGRAPEQSAIGTRPPAPPLAIG